MLTSSRRGEHELDQGMLAVVVAKGYVTEHLDAAFLECDLKETDPVHRRCCKKVPPAKGRHQPMRSDLKLSKLQSPKTKDERAQMTRPDVSYVVTQLSRFLEKPGNYWKTAIRIQYIKTSKNDGITYDGSASEVKASDTRTRTSTIDARRSV